eukprot:TRINITY_DN1431_c1_g1_i1.p1 TRINITY_DN1431_c1_g1~~TRINITY_DN1431_c1_g1_i1.p1  ORF type:complete len:171 (+),score=41.76 TRINITY_DN1431_c1_g1_i1:382-894(+)
MGARLSMLSNSPRRVAMVGLGGAGKTTILWKLNFGGSCAVTHGSVDALTYKEVTFSTWGLGAGQPPRAAWLPHAQDTCGVVFVVDANDAERVDEAKTELLKILSEDLPNADLLVFANKQDLPGAMSTAEVADRLGLHALRRPWYIQDSCGTTGDGLYEGFEWLCSSVSRR